MNKKIRAMVVAALTVASVFAFSTSAQAGQVAVNAPLVTGASYGASGGGPIVTGFSFNLNVWNPIGTWAYVKSQRLPATVNLDQMFFNANYSTGRSGTQPFAVRMCYYGIAEWSGATGCSGDQYAKLAAAPPSPRQNQNLGMACATQNANASAQYHCGGFQVEVAQAQNVGDVVISTNSATLSDYTAPAATTNQGSQTLNTSSWIRGTVQGGSNATDTEGVGINNVKLYVDGSQKSSQNYACNTGQWVPCAQSVNFNPNFDTTTVTDGPHNAFFTTSDIAANTGQSSTFQFKVDNTKPDSPTAITPTTNGANGWSSNNTLDASWTNGTETDETATKSGLQKVVVDVNPTDVSQSDPAPITVNIGSSASGIAATQNSVSGVTVPSPGAWTMRLSLIDKAGNVSNVGSGTESDTTIGYDPNPPAKPSGFANGWISRDELAAGFDQEFTYSPPPTSLAPVCGFAGAIDEDLNGVAGSNINVAGGGAVRKWRLPGTLTEDTHYVHLRSVGCNGIASPTTETVTAPVDRTDPVGTINGVENGKWYKDGKTVELRGSDVLSGMAPAPSNQVLSTKGAYLAYSINGNGPLDVDAPRGDSTTVPINGEGQKELKFSPVDLAGNKAAAKVSTFGIDATNPNGYVNHQDAARPTLLSAHLADAPSGVSYAIFSVRPAGGSDADWIQLPTSLAGVDGNVVGAAVATGTATARFPDTSLGQGTYDVRVQAFDQAGNPLSTQRYQDGSIAQVQNPMRAVTGVSLKLFKALRECKKNNAGKMKCAIKKCTKKTKGTCYKVLKGKVVLQGGSTTITSAYNRGAIATGTLTDASGNPLKNTDVTISTIAKANGKTADLGTATTDSHGIWAIRVPAGVNRTVKATYEGSELRRPANSNGTLNTQAKLKLKVSKKRAKTGQTISFTGKVTPFDAAFPSGGKIVALQFFAAKKWRPAVGVGHTDKNGKFKINYKFDGRKVKAKIIFRIVAPAEDAWGHAFSASKPVSIKLNY